MYRCHVFLYPPERSEQIEEGNGYAENTIINDMIKKEGLDAVVSGMAGTAAQALTPIQNNPGDYPVFLDFGKRVLMRNSLRRGF